MYKGFMNKLVPKKHKDEVQHFCEDCGVKTIKKGRCLDCKVDRMNKEEKKAKQKTWLKPEYI